MKAIVHETYGPPDVLELREVEKPLVGDDQVLVRVHAASINPYDWHFLRASPHFVRLEAGLRKPKRIITGVDAAGVVEAVGKDVTDLRPGDEVFGGRGGSCAQFVAGKTFVPKPANVTFEQAASVPMAACTALQGLRDKGGLRPGQTVLINGASGGVGTFAVQIAKSFGAEVTGVCSTKNVELVRSIGADHVIDYIHDDFTRMAKRYDLILDTVGNHSPSAVRRALKPQGTYVMVGGEAKGLLGGIDRLARAMVLSRFVSQRLRPLLATLNKDDLLVLKDLIEAGKVKPVIDKSYPLSEVPDAIRYVETGHARGKVVITI
jgi:NADPH:quinone reductase-like Zn-dependent oxidoreductase